MHAGKVSAEVSSTFHLEYDSDASDADIRANCSSRCGSRQSWKVSHIANVDHHTIVERPGLQLARRARLSPTTGKTHRSLRICAGDWPTGDAGGQVTVRRGLTMINHEQNQDQIIRLFPP